MIKKLLLIITLILVLLVVAAGGALTVVLTTEGGLQWISARLIPLIPGKLSYDSIHGRLAGTVTIRKLRYEMEDSTYSIEKVAITLQPGDLVRGIFHINRIEGSGFTFKQPGTPSSTQQQTTQTSSAMNSFSGLPLSIRLDRGEINDVSIMAGDMSQAFIVKRLGVDSITLDRSLTVKRLLIDAGDYFLSTGGTIRLSGDIVLDLDTTWRAAVPGYTTLAGNGTISGDLQQLTLSQIITGPFKASIGATLSEPFSPSQTQLKMTGEWHNFNWPPDTSHVVSSPQGKIQLTGNLDQYQYSLIAKLRDIPQTPSGTLTVDGNGGRNSTTFDRIYVATLGGSIRGHGRLSWQPQLAWQFTLNGNNIDPAVQWQDWPGTISFATTMKGGLENNEPHTDVEIERVTGTLRGYPIAAKGTFGWQPDIMKVTDVEIMSDNNSLSADGTFSDQWDIDWEVEAPEINALLPQLRGTIRGKGRIAGARQNPHISLSALGKSLTYESYTAASLEVSADIDLLSTQPSAINLVAEDIHAGKATLDEVELQAIGTADKHTFRATFYAPHTSGEIDINASLQNRQWSGTISKANVTSSEYGEWTLNKPFRYSAATDEVNIARACWQNKQPQLCMEGQWQQDTGGTAALSATDIPLAFAARWLPPTLAVTGTIDAQANLDLGIQGDVTGTGELVTKSGQLSHTLASGTDIDTEYNEAVVTLRLTEESIRAEAHVDISKDNTAQALVVLPQTALNINNLDTLKDAPLQGQLDAAFDDLELLPYFIPEVENTNGIVKIAIALDGTVAQPRLSTSAHIKDAAAEIPRYGLQLQNIRLNLSGDAINNLDFNGRLQSGEGDLAVDGTLGWDTENRLHLQLSSTGTRFEVVNIPEYHVFVSPLITVEINHRSVDVNGTITIPEARIEPRDLTTTRTPSSDVVIHNEDTTNIPQRWQISSIINISLGEKVSFNGFGLTGNIDGNVAIIDTPGQITTAYGQLQIHDGVYQLQIKNKGLLKVVKREMTIETGRLLFVGGPVDNPGLDIRAIREIKNETGNVVAGVNVRGTLKDPRPHFFSTPPMAEKDILSYIILGRPISEASQSEGEALYGVALSVGLAGSELLAKEIGSIFKIEDVYVESGSTPEESQFVVGTHFLSPKLYISYGVGIIERINTFRLRYTLNDKWSLRSESGIESGADLFYTLEK